MKCVHYIGWYIHDNDEQNYFGNVPGKLKMRYVANKIMECGVNLSILSLANKKCSFFYRKKIIRSENLKITYAFGFSTNNRFLKALNAILKKIQFIFYIIFKVKKSDKIILYHSTEFTRIMEKIKKYLKRYVILEIEEIYGYSALEDKKWVNNEILAIKKMNSFIVVNDGISRELSLNREKCVVSYGVIDFKKRNAMRFDDGRIHIVYAGTIEMRKQGALMAVEVSKHLPKNYFLHIIGFGKKENIDTLLGMINNVNSNYDENRVAYEGYLTGDELDRFLFKCHIGLSSNVMRPNFANNSFPSKVITYMCHGLSVVMGYASAFLISPFSEKWNFYNEYIPQKIADSIIKAEIVDEDYYYDLLIESDNNLKKFLETELKA